MNTVESVGSTFSSAGQGRVGLRPFMRHHVDKPQRSVALAVFGIEFDGFSGRLPRYAEPLSQGDVAVGDLPGGHGRDPRPSRRVTRIESERTLEAIICFGEILAGIASLEIPALQVEAVGFRIHRSCRRGGGRGQKRELQFLHDALRDLVLNLEHVLEIAIIGLRPNIYAVAGANQLGGDADGVAGFAHAALHDIGNVQGLGDFADGGLLALEDRTRRFAR